MTTDPGPVSGWRIGNRRTSSDDDRKSNAQGKRVGLGARRSIQKKNRQQSGAQVEYRQQLDESYIDDRQQSGDQVEDRQHLMEPYIDAGSTWNPPIWTVRLEPGP